MQVHVLAENIAHGDEIEACTCRLAVINSRKHCPGRHKVSCVKIDGGAKQHWYLMENSAPKGRRGGPTSGMRRHGEDFRRGNQILEEGSQTPCPGGSADRSAHSAGSTPYVGALARWLVGDLGPVLYMYIIVFVFVLLLLFLFLFLLFLVFLLFFCLLATCRCSKGSSACGR